MTVFVFIVKLLVAVFVIAVAAELVSLFLFCFDWIIQALKRRRGGG